MNWWLGAIAGALAGILLSAVLKPLNDLLQRASDVLYGVKPVSVHVEHDQMLIWANYPPWLSFSYYFPDGPPLEPPPEVLFDTWQWAHRNGGADLGRTMIQVTIQAKANVSVVIEDFVVRNSKKHHSGGFGVLFPAPGGAELEPRRVDVDLDGFDPPIVEFRMRDGQEAGRPPALQLSAGAVERFHIWIDAHTGVNNWHIQLPLLVDGNRETIEIGSARKPFTTVGWEVPSGIFTPSQGGWEELGPIARFP